MTGRKTVLYNGAAGRHIWEVYLAKVLSNSSLYVRDGGILVLEVPC
jgi:hypothetical protein